MNSRDRKYIKDLIEPVNLKINFVKETVEDIKKAVNPKLEKHENRIQTLEDIHCMQGKFWKRFWQITASCAGLGILIVAIITLIRSI